MNRREEIELAWFSKAVQSNHRYDERSFKEAVEWADKTMIKRARQWFNLHFRQVGTPKEIKHDFESKERMWKSFTQFMEE